MRKLTFFILILCSACTYDHGNFTVISNKIVDIKNFDLNNSPKTPKVKGEDIKHIVIAFPTGVPTVSAALNDAFDNSGTDVLTNANISFTHWYIPYLYGQTGWTVTGTGVKTRKN